MEDYSGIQPSGAAFSLIGEELRYTQTDPGSLILNSTGSWGDLSKAGSVEFSSVQSLSLVRLFATP